MSGLIIFSNYLLLPWWHGQTCTLDETHKACCNLQLTGSHWNPGPPPNLVSSLQDVIGWLFCSFFTNNPSSVSLKQYFINNGVVMHKLNSIGKIPQYRHNFSLYWQKVFYIKPFLSCILLGLYPSAPLLVHSYFYASLNAPIFPPRYNEETDQILHYERVSLIDLEKIEMGPYTWWVPAW